MNLFGDFFVLSACGFFICRSEVSGGVFGFHEREDQLELRQASSNKMLFRAPGSAAKSDCGAPATRHRWSCDGSSGSI